MRPCGKYEITIEKLLDIVHTYTDPVRIEVIMGDAWRTCEEAKHMKDFLLTKKCGAHDRAEQVRLLKYYKDVPVWNLSVWLETSLAGDERRAVYTGIAVRCHYQDMREGWLAEKADRAKERKRVRVNYPPLRC